MRVELDQDIGLTEQVVAGLEPDALVGADAAELTERFARLERLAGAGKSMCAGRAARAGEHERAGHRHPGVWLAGISGESVGKAASALETADSLENHPTLAAAFRSGDLSGQQAAEISAAADADSSKEGELVDLARKGSYGELRRRAEQVRAAARPDDEAAHEAVHRSRYLRGYLGRDGAYMVEARLTKDDGATVMRAVAKERDRLFDAARREGRRERSEAYAADALVALLGRDPATQAGGSARKGSSSDGTVHLRVDLSALRRGWVAPGEMCEIPGVAAIPVSVARTVLGDHLLKLVISDGVDIRTVCHLGRAVPAHLRTALEERDPVCVVPTCDVASGLEIDHRVIPFAQGGPASLQNLSRICRYHHFLKTHKGFRLEGGPGSWRWIPPKRTRGGRPDGPGPPEDESPAPELRHDEEPREGTGRRAAARRGTPSGRVVRRRCARSAVPDPQPHEAGEAPDNPASAGLASDNRRPDSPACDSPVVDEPLGRTMPPAQSRLFEAQFSDAST